MGHHEVKGDGTRRGLLRRRISWFGSDFESIIKFWSICLVLVELQKFTLKSTGKSYVIKFLIYINCQMVTEDRYIIDEIPFEGKTIQILLTGDWRFWIHWRWDNEMRGLFLRDFYNIFIFESLFPCLGF